MLSPKLVSCLSVIMLKSFGTTKMYRIIDAVDSPLEICDIKVAVLQIITLTILQSNNNVWYLILSSGGSYSCPLTSREYRNQDSRSALLATCLKPFIASCNPLILSVMHKISRQVGY